MRNKIKIKSSQKLDIKMFKISKILINTKNKRFLNILNDIKNEKEIKNKLPSPLDIQLDVDDFNFLKTFTKYDYEHEIPRVPIKKEKKEKNDSNFNFNDISLLLGLEEEKNINKPNDKDIESLYNALENENNIKRGINSTVLDIDKGVLKDLSINLK